MRNVAPQPYSLSGATYGQKYISQLVGVCSSLGGVGRQEKGPDSSLEGLDDLPFSMLPMATPLRHCNLGTVSFIFLPNGRIGLRGFSEH